MTGVRAAGAATAVWLRGEWARQGSRVLAAMVGCMVIAALWRLGNELPRLLFDADGAFDLRLRHSEVARWFAGQQVYGEPARGDYPPASYVLLWPLVGWLPLGHARGLWAATSIAALAWLGWLGVRGSTAATRTQLLLFLLLPVSTYAASATIRIGQVGNHVLPLLVAAPLLLAGGRHVSWRRDAGAAGLLLLALVKPTLSAPFVWLAATLPGRVRPFVLVCGGYAVLTGFAILFQPEPLGTALLGWMQEPPQALRGHGNVEKLLALLDLEAWSAAVSLAMLFGLGLWLLRFRHSDPWLQIGVCALVAQFWTHHRMYDHMLMIPPMIALFRVARSGAQPGGRDVTAGILFGLCWLSLHAPASILARPDALAWMMELTQVIIWLAMLVFLLRVAAGRSDRGLAAGAPGGGPAEGARPGVHSIDAVTR